MKNKNNNSKVWKALEKRGLANNAYVNAKLFSADK